LPLKIATGVSDSIDDEEEENKKKDPAEKDYYIKSYEQLTIHREML
jgi:hypothetical protein